MVAAVSAKTPNPKFLLSKTPNSNVRNSSDAQQNPKRPPLLPSEAENGPNGQLRRPKSREVTSRYLSSSSTSTTSSISTSSSSNSSNSISSRRSASPMVSRTMTPTMTPTVQNSARRAQSAERRRPVTPRAPAVEMEMPSAAKALMMSKRSLSVSFQGESFLMPSSKAKPAPSPAPAQAINGSSIVRRGTPERRRVTPVKDRSENSCSKPSDQQRWPARSKPLSSTFLTRSLDYGAASNRAGFGGSVSAAKKLQKSMIDENDKLKTETKIIPDIKNFEVQGNVEPVLDGNSAIALADAAPLDSDSVSSGSTSGSLAQVRGAPRGIVVPARFWQETNNRVRRVSEPGSPVSKNNGSKVTTVSKFPGAKKLLNESSILSPRGFSSPIQGAARPASPVRGAARPASPNKSLTPFIGSFRGMPSPVKTRNGVSTLCNDVSSTPSILNFAADMRRGKVGENRIIDAHELRLLHNRQLQWRFVNARAESAILVQTETAERTLYNAWVATTKLRNSVKSKRTELQLLSQNLRLFSILQAQVPDLDNWDIIEGDHCAALSGTIEAFEASTVRLPVVAGARADIHDVENALGSAVDVMQSMASSICSLLTKVEQVNTCISELASLTKNERALIYQCKDLLSNLTAMEVKDCSLRTHILQLERSSANLTTTEVQS